MQPAVIFDMDGVLVNSEPLHERSFLDVFAEIGYAENHGVDFPSYYGQTDRIVWRDFVERHRPPHTLEELLQRKEVRFKRLLEVHQPIFPGVLELLPALRQRYALGLASGSRHPVIQAVLALSDLRAQFQAVVSSEDVLHGKPAPDVFLRTAQLLGVDPEHCWVIEDSIAGVEAALAAGMRVIAIPNSLPAAALARAHHVLHTYDEIGRLLLG